ncbi:hypothetical protein XOC_2864 [Xanthomonas oryzae pv. oryzicola BLS256]|uniref:Uncharacterized protein n=1 Tax=Xanthomonas oryzae pv. oryzicola (strain BLS256) TaxID=383407 RepID=G7TK37_XANOB|nr:hypothetical protein XOC_2864 [Xanthomonas oryzae pv. oryzicola BLS256]
MDLLLGPVFDRNERQRNALMLAVAALRAAGENALGKV